ncbi:MAG: GAF and ANTAR domain-containing protein [Acidimicrobiales bacterium]|jgi:GAF domain-containing protein
MDSEDVLAVSEDPISDLSDSIAHLFSAERAPDTLEEVVGLAVSTIEGCDYAGIFVVEGDSMSNPVSTDPIVIQLGDIHRRTMQGPCIDAMASGEAFYAEDLAYDERWPEFGREMSEAGIRSLLALPMALDGSTGALNLYARYPHAFGVIDRGRALLLAAIAGAAYSTVRSHEEEERRATELHAALATREMIGQAQGILMERERISADAAFDILRRASQHLNIKLRVVAQNLVDTGERPDTGQPTGG